jgi:Thiopurine S-methyltransferase (TPMT).
MDPVFWLQRWNEGRIGFHRGEVMPLLEKHWPALGVPAGGRVFVPLAGKTLDMHWLAAQGHAVLGAELSPLAVRAFFAEAGLEPAVAEDGDGCHHRAGPVDLGRAMVRTGRLDPGRDGRGLRSRRDHRPAPGYAPSLWCPGCTPGCTPGCRAVAAGY